MEGVSFQIVAHWCALMEKPLSQKNGNISRNEDQCFFFSTQRKHDNTWPSKKKKDHSCLKCVKQTSGMRREGESKVWFNSPFSLIGGVGNTYPFCAAPLRFRPVHADECPWFDYLTVTGKFREHNRGPIPPPRISHHLCNTKKENQKGMIFTKIFNLANIVGNWNLL